MHLYYFCYIKINPTLLITCRVEFIVDPTRFTNTIEALCGDISKPYSKISTKL